MSNRLGRALRGLFFVCLGVAALPAIAQVRQEGAIPDGRGGVGVLATGMHHTCGLRADGTAACWGDNYNGEAKPLPGAFIELSAGFEHTCGLRGDGSVECWGQGYVRPEDVPPPPEGYPPPPPPPSPIPAGAYTALASGMSTTCALRVREQPWLYPEGNVACWSADGWSQLPAPPAGDFVALSLGDNFACGLRADGHPACWGGPMDDPQRVPTEDTFIAISAGAMHACGLHADGSVRCWGENWSGQATPPAELFTAIGAGVGHTCGLRTDGQAQCWGENWANQSTPPTEDRFIALSVGAFHNCGVRTNGTIACWGDVRWIANHDPSAPPPMFPQLPWEGSFGVGQLAAGDWHHCQLTPEGRLSCWGGFDRDPAPWTGFSAVSSGQNATCARGEMGLLQCFGGNGEIQLNLPIEPLRQFDLGYEHGCGVLALDGRAQCWGRETNDKTLAPEGLFRTQSAGLMHSCGVRADGNGECWGYNGDGQTAVLPLPPGRGYLTVEAGERHSCGLDSDQHIRCWGMSPPPHDPDNWDPDYHPDFATFRALSVGAYHSCAIRTDGRLLCWGEDWSGQLGVPEGTFVAVSAGHTHTCAIRTDGSRECWGDPWMSPKLVLDPAENLRGVRPGEWLDVQFQLRSESPHPAEEPTYAIVAGTLPPGFRLEPHGSLHGSWHETGRFPITVEGRDRNGFAARRDYVLSIDDTPPVIEPRISGTTGENGWYISPVEVSWSVTDPESDIRWSYGCDPAQVQNETPDAGFFCHAESAGGPAFNEVHVKVDLVAPSVWVRSFDNSGALATIEFEGHDPMSGVAGFECSLDGAEFTPCTSPLQSTFAPGSHEMRIRAVDFAGHRSEPTPKTWFTDATAPEVTAEVSGPRGLNDWYIGDVQIQWQLRDDETPISAAFGCELATLSSDALQAGFTCTATSQGGTTVREVLVKRDATPPETTITAKPDKAINATSATFEFDGSDATSGVTGYECSLDGAAFAVCASPFEADVTPGAHSFAVRAVDRAGLRDASPATHAWQVDVTAPTVTPSVTGTLGSNGWYVGNVQISWNVADAESAASTTGCNTVVLTSDTSGAGFTCSATSTGGTTTRTVTVKRDTTAPAISAAATTAPNAAGWYRGDVTVGFTCSDATSGVVACPAAQVLGGEGSAIASAARSVTDAAGNSAVSKVVTVDIDRTAPTLAPSVTPGTLLLNATTTANANGGDALSGLASAQCAPLSTGSVGSKTVTCTVTDRAGNSASGNATYRVTYGFNGFTSPVQNPSVLNVLKAGRSVPLRWRVVDAQGAPVSNLGAASVGAVAISCPNAAESRIGTYGGSNGQLQNLGNGYYQLDWVAASSLRWYCRRLELNLGDGEVHPALFKFN